MFTGISYKGLFLSCATLLAASGAFAQIPANPCTPGAIGVGLDSTVDFSFGIIVDNNCALLDALGNSSPPNTGPGEICGTNWEHGSVTTCTSNFTVTTVTPPDGINRSCAQNTGLGFLACGGGIFGNHILYCCT
ncbi:hypothetical protein SISSUDRAFT_1031608 [Sistotremastrum suecicum HHB10207 ss-3]|uniref:Cyanovirin-N domain-containing protein n=1 Tax=Sistotremastrum suecicum HHB10207 ss-3 TaxID=1314776 RepID=A0A166FPK3_9AGAM|nr:hypothetical protein SISSUDRAFT_1031608 [Sistotremastrum suecicum HHB10207 ss-3]